MFYASTTYAAPAPKTLVCHGFCPVFWPSRFPSRAECISYASQQY